MRRRRCAPRGRICWRCLHRSHADVHRKEAHQRAPGNDRPRTDGRKRRVAGAASRHRIELTPRAHQHARRATCGVGAEGIMSESARRGLLIAKGWIQAVVIVVLCGFLILGILAYRTYTDEPPIASQVVDPAGHVLFTGADVIAGQEVFLRNGLMEYGSIFGHGAYLGPDFTADYLHRAALVAIDHYGGSSSEAAR